MRRIMLSSLLVASLMPTLVQSTTTAEAGERSRRNAAIVAGAILGAAVLAASSRDHRHEYHRAYGGYQPRWRGAFSPAPRVTCYPRQRLCYRRDGRIARKWTRRYYR
jgi:hypothetical protein